MRVRPAATLLAVFIVLSLICGCGSAGPPRYRLSGKVTYDGQPVPFGWIVFSPERGPGASANIENGTYETPDGFGAIGGKHKIEVVAFASAPQPIRELPDGTSGGGPPQPLFTYTFEHELPQETTTWDIAVTPEDVQQQAAAHR